MNPTLRSRRLRGSFCRARRCSALLALCAFSGCVSSNLQLARSHYYGGDYEKSAAALDVIPDGNTERALHLMERGMIQQARGAYKESTEDWLRAHELTEHLDYLSLSRGSTSLLINDNVMAFRGAFYERVLLHSFAAMSYLAMDQWDGAGVEARNIINKLETRNKFPDDPYSRYVAGFFLETTGDNDGASLQYRMASDAMRNLAIDPVTGKIRTTGPRSPGSISGSSSSAGSQLGELVCFIGLGSSGSSYRPGGPSSPGRASHVALFDGDQYLGRSVRIASVPALRRATDKVQEKSRKAKRAARIAIKEAAAQVAASEDEALGDIVRLILFSLETDDVRHWETLPRDLHVARVPCSTQPRKLRFVFKTPSGKTIAERPATAPIARRGKIYCTFMRAY